jgi:hypothetical protein
MSDTFDSIEITSRRDLLTSQRDVAQRLSTRPDLAAMLLTDPLQAFERMGLRMSPAMADCVLYAIRHPHPIASSRRYRKRRAGRPR